MKIKHWLALLILGIAQPILAYDDSGVRFQDRATERYYEDNRQLYEQMEAEPQYVGDDAPRVRMHHMHRMHGRHGRHVGNESNPKPRYKYGHYSPDSMPNQISATGGKVFIFNPRILTWAIYNPDGSVVRKGHGSGGQPYCTDIHRACRTPVGQFRVSSKEGSGCISSIYPKPYGGARMPYCMFFHKGYAIHGSDFVPDYDASHGCIRLYPADAEWLNHNWMTVGTKVIVQPY